MPLLLLSDRPTAHISALSLHDALPISRGRQSSSFFGGDDAHEDSAAGDAHEDSAAGAAPRWPWFLPDTDIDLERIRDWDRSEEHTSELQSRGHLVCRLLLEKKNIQDGK